MKAIAVFPTSKEVRLVDHPEPAISRPGEVKVQIVSVGVCGTDREIWDFKYGTPPEGSDYLITGHEALGRVVEVGADVTGVRVGDYVVPTVRRGCPENCISCERGLPDFCFTGHFKERGIKQAHGFMTEYIVDDQKYMTVIPEDVAGDAVLLEPLTIAEKTILQLFTIQSRLPWECRVESGTGGTRPSAACHNALVLGAGPVGLLGAMALRLLHMKVFVVAREAKPNAKSRLLDGIGADYHSTLKSSPQQIAQHMGNVDLVFEATGAAKVSFDFLQVLGTNGIFVFTGVPAPMRDITIDAGSLMRNIVLKNQVVLGTVNAPKAAFENGIRDLKEFRRQWPRELSSMITARLPADRFRETIQRTHPEEIKTVLEFAPSLVPSAV